eukprot:5238033-Prymnesium_polylepis.1
MCRSHEKNLGRETACPQLPRGDDEHQQQHPEAEKNKEEVDACAQRPAVKLLFSEAGRHATAQQDMPCDNVGECCWGVTALSPRAHAAP